MTRRHLALAFGLLLVLGSGRSLWATAAPVVTPAGGTFAAPQPLSPASISVTDTTSGYAINACYTTSATQCTPGTSGTTIACPGSGACSIWVAPTYPNKDNICVTATAASVVSLPTCGVYQAPPPSTIATGDSITRSEPAFLNCGTNKYAATAYQVITTAVNLGPWNPTIATPGTLNSTGGASFEPSTVSGSYTAAETDDTGLKALMQTTATNGCVEVTLGTSGQDAIVLNRNFQLQNSSGGPVSLVVDGGVRIYKTRNLTDFQTGSGSNSSCGTFSTTSPVSTSCPKWIVPAVSGTLANPVQVQGYGIFDARGWDRFTSSSGCPSGYSPCSFNTLKVLSYCLHPGNSDNWPGSGTGAIPCTGTTTADSSVVANGPNSFQWSGISHVVMYKITVLDSAQFQIYWGDNSTDFLGWGIKFLAAGNVSNTDGFDPSYAAINWSLYGSFCNSGDNCVAIKSDSGSNYTAGTTQNGTINNFQTGATAGVTIGDNATAAGGVTNVLVSGLQQNAGYAVNSHSQWGHGIEATDSGAGPISLITYQHTCVTDNSEYSLQYRSTGPLTQITDFDTHILSGHDTGNSGLLKLEGASSSNLLGLTFNAITADGAVTTTFQDLNMTVGALGINSTTYGTISGASGSNVTIGANASPIVPASVPCVIHVPAQAADSWKPLIGELWLATSTQDNLQSLTVAAPASYTLKATMIPARAFPSTKESYFPNYTSGGTTGTQSNPYATVNFTDTVGGSTTTVCSNVQLVHGDEFASCSLTGVTAGTHNYQVVYNSGGNDPNYPTSFTWGNPGTAPYLSTTVTGTSSSPAAFGPFVP